VRNSPSRLFADRLTLRLDRREPYLRIHHVTMFVRDQDRSLRFYLDQLGFSLVADYRYGSGERWVAVAPADGSAILALVTPKPDSEEYNLIGQSGQVVLVTEDVPAKFQEWRDRGIQFRHPPRTPDWGGTFTSFEDVDGNSFVLVGFDDASREIEAQRNAISEKLESERRAAQELEIAKQAQARLFPQRCPQSGHSTMRVFASRLAKSVAITTVTEALNDAGNDFATHSLIESLRRHREQPASVLVASIVDDVKKFSSHEQSDDITLIVAKAR
jgi:catechol 2,3-dioxygenase-like lactoylglutathione lyase family enzyme